MLATSAFLFTTHPGGEQLPAFYQWVLLSHIAGGLLILLPLVLFVIAHARQMAGTRNVRVMVPGLLLTATGVLLAITGLTVMTQANSTAYRLVFRVHQVAALLVPALFLAHRFLSRRRPSPRRAAIGLATVLLLFGGLALGLRIAAGPAASEERMVRIPPLGPAHSGNPDPFVPFTPPALAPPDALFFPSPVTTSSGGNAPVAAITGSEECRRCHPDVVAQWESSAHRFSSMNNPFYRVAVNDLRALGPEGMQRSQWCGACHDPALLFPGAMRSDFDPESPQAHAGLTCAACHRIDQVHNLAGNGGYRFDDDDESPYLFADAEGETGRFLNERLIKSKPEVHRRRMLKPFFRDPAYCAVCHKVSLDRPVNFYRFLRGQDEYDDWHNSGVSRNSPRTFYLPEEVRSCQDCHMPREPATLGDVSARGGTVKSHRFLAANTALPAVRGDREMVAATERFFSDGKLRIDVFALLDDEIGLVAPLDRGLAALSPGETVTFGVVVRNRGVGHMFPGGTNDSNEAWIDFRVEDEEGREVFRSGQLLKDRRVDPGAHFYRAVFVDRDSRRAATRNPQDFRSLVYVNVIPPGNADFVRYLVRVPDARELRITATLKWRKFNREYTEYVFEKLGRPVPNLPITDLAVDQVTLGVGVPASPIRKTRAEDWERFNDCGIALLRQGDSRAAGEAFRRAADADPLRADGPLNLARVALIEGDISGALEYLEGAEKLAPDEPRLPYFFGRAFRAAGRYDQAKQAFLASQAAFPGDRGTLKELGTLAYLSGEFEEALTWFQQALTIDPEDVDAHYHRMKAYRALGRSKEAFEASKAYEKYKPDDNAPRLLREYLLRDKEINREAQKIHVHR